MFLQIELHPSERDSHRYLWRDMDLSSPSRIYRFKRVTFGVACSPFPAIATVQNHARMQKDKFPLAAEEILNNMFVDDCLSGSDDDESASRLLSELSRVLRSGGFELTKWASNSTAVMAAIPVKDRNPSLTVGADQSMCMKALGVTWNPRADTLSLDVVPVIESTDKETKRSTLSLIAKLYDPFGFAAPFTVKAKLLIKELWLHGQKWDEKLADCCLEKWRDWKTQLQTIQHLELPRFLHTCGTGSIELYCFSDASMQAYGAVVYCRNAQNDQEYQSSLIMSKTRVAPTKRVTLPRLELLGAVVGAKLVKFVAESMHQSDIKIVCWTDSQVALHWIRKAPHLLKSFVGNRVSRFRVY